MQTDTLPNIDQLVATANLKPDVPGRIHGIVNLDPVQVQCDGCGRIDEGKHFGLTILQSSIVFCPAEYAKGDERRMCVDCRAKAGWKLGWRDAR